MPFSFSACRATRARFIFACALCLIASSSLFACSDSGGKNAAQRPAPVRLARAVQKDVPRTLEAVGNVSAFSSVQVKSQVAGQIIDVPVEAGQEVFKGDLLFKLDPRPFDAALAEARARLTRNQALLAKARKDLARYTSLMKQDVISREAFDQVATAESTIRADIEQDKAAIKTAALNREYAEIRAPVAGKLGDILIRNGNVIKANDERTLVVINSIRPAEVRFTVAERYLPALLALMQKGALYTDVLPQGDEGQPIRGKVTAVDNEVDRTTGSIRLYALFENDEGRLWPGQFVRARLVLATLKNAILVPEHSIQEGMSGAFLYRALPSPEADGSRGNLYAVEPVQVKTEPGPEGFTVITKGLRPGDIVVTEGQLGLSPGRLAQDVGERAE